jgi:YidC/Oxa1 family membrane protein insertase
LAKLEENKKKPKAQPKWQEKMEQIKETQKKLDDMKNKTSKK